MPATKAKETRKAAPQAKTPSAATASQLQDLQAFARETQQLFRGCSPDTEGWTACEMVARLREGEFEAAVKCHEMFLEAVADELRLCGGVEDGTLALLNKCRDYIDTSGEWGWDVHQDPCGWKRTEEMEEDRRLRILARSAGAA